MKKNLFFLFAFIFISSYAQLDREHWFGPMVDRVSNFNAPTNADNQTIYMSTGETTPFKVDVYFNNAVVATYTLSKNNPQTHKISSGDREEIIIAPGPITPTTGLFQPVTMGFYLKGEKPFFASLRFSVYNHGEIVTSKGTAALGTEFRSVTAPLLAFPGYLNTMTSVMATENNTKVTISEFKSDIIFWDEIPKTEITFELNKGQSYIVEINDIWYENQTGFIGAKIVSDKPVVVTNGNFNGQYAGNISGSDILMDQAVPVNKLGKTFVLVKGNGANSFTSFGSTTTMEKAIIVAVKDNTKIYLNGNTTPVALLKAGEFFTTPPDSYVDQGSQHYNMYIESSEDIYVYQLLAGRIGQTSNPNGEATGGFNYIPPLSCYLPKKIDEIGLIDENLFFSNTNPSGRLSVPTKLNVITGKGASIEIKRNGTILPITAANGPHKVSGTSSWETYSFPDITGNIAVFSTKAVTAGISAGDDAVGYGGYFAGFSFTPLIQKTSGDCLLPGGGGVTLAVTEGFDYYEWLVYDGSKYIPALGVNNLFHYEPAEAGIYAVKVKEGSCAEIQTKDFKFYNCTTFTNNNFETCTSQIVKPKFALSLQSVNVNTVKIDSPPKKGKAEISLTTGIITYTADPNATESDTFKYSFCGNGPIPDCEIAQATIQLHQISKSDVILNKCSVDDTSVFDLNMAMITPDINAQKKYYSDSTFLTEIPQNLLANYPAKSGDQVFVFIKNDFGCEATAIITLQTNVSSIVKISNVAILYSTVTVKATGGTPPYRYAIDNKNYQSSNVFMNVSGGSHTLYVNSEDNCVPASAIITVIASYNTITPNDDGINDIFDYSGLLKKTDPVMRIFDRFGKMVFTGDVDNKFSWDGKIGGNLANTGSYWYIMYWKEPGSESVIQRNGWVLLRNR